MAAPLNLNSSNRSTNSLPILMDLTRLFDRWRALCYCSSLIKIFIIWQYSSSSFMLAYWFWSSLRIVLERLKKGWSSYRLARNRPQSPFRALSWSRQNRLQSSFDSSSFSSFSRLPMRTVWNFWLSLGQTVGSGSSSVVFQYFIR